MNCSTLHIEVIPSLIFLQETGDTGNPVGPAAPGQASDAVAIVDGDAGAAGSDSAFDPFGGNFFLILMLFVLGMIVFSAFGGRKQRKKRATMLDALKKHDQVVTRGGVFGSIVEIKPDRVVLKVDESSNTRITVVRDSIEQVTNGTTD